MLGCAKQDPDEINLRSIYIKLAQNNALLKEQNDNLGKILNILTANREDDLKQKASWGTSTSKK
jgi:hypothetical protein